MALTIDAFGHDPIERFEDDRLDREDFAKLLARALAGSPERRSMVVALYGDWGSGKTSTLNLCFEALKKLPPEKQPLVVRFNPWWYSNTGELLAQFFEQLGSGLEKQAEQKRIDALDGIKDRLVSYRKLIAPAGAVADLFVSGGALTLVANVVQAGVERAAQEQEGSRDVREVRTEIEKALRDANRPVMIAIDDIDRLSASEIRDVFKVVKATADFPNTRYLLAFDFDTVATALSEVQHTNGAAYLEKIVQVPFRLPDPASGQLMAIVMEGVEQIASQQENISDEELQGAKVQLSLLTNRYGLGALWDNMRRVNRFLDSLRMTLPTVAGDVRLADFVLLEALRVTVPRAYELILDGQSLLVGTAPGADIRSTRPRSDDRQEQANQATAALVEAICDATEREALREDLKDVVRSVLEELFPRAKVAIRRGFWVYGGDVLDEWTTDKRVCIPDFFRIATRWGLPSGTISNSEIRSLVSITDPQDLRERLRIYDEDVRDGVDYAATLERIGLFYRTDAEPPALEAILRVVPGEERADRAHRIMVSLARETLKRLSDVDVRKRILLGSIEIYGVLPVMADLLRDLGMEHGWVGREPLPENYRTLPPAQFQEVRDEALADIKNQAEESTLLSRHPFSQYLDLWRNATDDDEPKEYLRQLLRDREGFVQLLNTLVGEETARQLGERESLPNALDVVQRLRPLWVFGLDGEARALADELLAGEVSDADRYLIEWFVSAHESANKPIENE